MQQADISPYKVLHASARNVRQFYRDMKRYLKLLKRGRLISVPMAKITDEFAFALGPQGWNYYSAIAQEYDQNSAIDYQTSLYCKFFKNSIINRLRSLEEVLFFDQPTHPLVGDKPGFYLGTYPWGGLTEEDSEAGGTPFGWYYDQVSSEMTRDLWGYGKTLWYKPEDAYTLQAEWNYTVRLYHVLKDKGYHPLLYRSFPRVTTLRRQNGDLRAVIVDGHHRLAILSYFGYSSVVVEVAQEVHEAEVNQWHYVKQGLCTSEHALAIFNAFFELNGCERLQYLNLTTASHDHL